MRIHEIRTETEFDHLRPAWDALAPNCSCASTFLTWEWASAWWRAYGAPGDLRILTAVDEQGSLVGIAPLRRQLVTQFGQTVEALTFIGDGSNDSDYLDFVIAAGREPEVLDQFEQHWNQQLPQGVVLLLNEIPENSPSLGLLRSWAAQRQAICREVTVPCGTTPLPDHWDAYLAKLKPRFRTKVRSVLRMLEARSDITFGFCQSRDEAEQLLPVLYDLHTRRWRQDGKPGVFGWKEKRDFYAAVSPLLLDRGWLRFSWLKWRGRVLACQYGFTYGTTYYHLQEGYEPEAEHWNVGIGLRAWSIREFIRLGFREYDFLGGVGRHKTDWGAETKHGVRLTIASRSLRNGLFCHGPEWKARAREAAAAVLPEKVLAVRRALLAPKADAGDWGWSRQLAANCYYHLRLPALVRRWREDYSLSITSNGKLPRISVEKRNEASARILYYHRVNDDNDPFFRATPTAVFEQQMRHLAQHYKVVSLAEMQDHLESDSRETVLAITFDDGYQDNYDYALPILRKYGLPATIFLTTGSLDTREPLWFERILLALKQTQREYIDLEMDLPRRFWTRTLKERLDANERLYALLRVMPDSERQFWLERILEALGGITDERHGKMLTWDRVREMTKYRIDFGGHTVNHGFLSKATPEQARWEVSECKRRIEEETQLPVAHFAYPSGREQDFADWNKDTLRAAGYRAAVSTIWGLNYRSTDRMALRRGQPWEEAAAQFAYKLDWYQLVNG
jgi:peptidoglycan/xylan/chitin deacetylase (PgdA/CDA1 family)/CelD/BcsL family acetyltransferase involved in cellulose biosynthesis